MQSVSRHLLHRRHHHRHRRRHHRHHRVVIIATLFGWRQDDVI